MSIDPLSETMDHAMRIVLARHPDLQVLGFGVSNRRRKTDDEIRTEMARGRAKILEDRSLKQFEAIRAWLRQFPKTTRPNHRDTSYGLKRAAEDAVGYCYNGVFIAAAIAEGFEVKRAGSISPNAWINISSKAWGGPT